MSTFNRARVPDYFQCAGCDEVVAQRPVHGMWTPDKSNNAGCAIAYKLCARCGAAMASNSRRMFEIVDRRMSAKHKVRR
jgi:ribosomal protein L37AE/L43A